MVIFAKNDVNFLLMRRFNQDPLENFFGKIRSLNGNAFLIQLLYNSIIRSENCFLSRRSRSNFNEFN